MSFSLEDAEFLGHVINPTGVGPNQKQVIAVKEFPIPQNVLQDRQFLGLALLKIHWTVCKDSELTS